MVAKKKSISQRMLEESAKEREAAAERLANRQALAKAEKLTKLRQQIKDLKAEVEKYRNVERIIETLEANPAKTFRIPAKERSAGVQEATAVQCLSDLHLEEEVKPELVNGINEFNLEIAEQSMRSLAIGTSWMIDTLSRTSRGRSGYKIRELYLPCFGDIISNYLRDEDIHGNALTPTEAVLFAIEQLSSYIENVLEACPNIERVYMPIISGNHDRLAFTRSTPYRGRQKLSMSVILAHGIRTHFAKDKRVKVELGTSEHHYTEIYGHSVRIMHGDRFNYQGGVGGIFVPARRHISALNRQKHAHITLFGHWHTSKEDSDWVSNGSLIGPNEYSTAKGLDPEPPSQTFMVLDKRRGKRMTTPIQVRELYRW